MKDDAGVRPITITHVFDAPRGTVWRAWTEPEQLKRWFMPHGFTIPVFEVDLREGGVYRMTVRGPDGGEHQSGGVFTEIDPPARLVFTTTAFEGPDGAPLLEVRNTATFTDLGSRTRLELHAVVTKVSPEAAGALAGMEEGWLQSFEKLDAILTGREVDTTAREVLATRVLDAARETVWKAWTDPDQGAAGLLHDGATLTYLAVQEPAVLAYLAGDPGEPGHAFTTVEFADDGGTTTVTVRLHFASAQERARMVDEQRAQQELETSLDRFATSVKEAS